MLSLRSLSLALTLTALFACAAKGQSRSGTVTAHGRVSETVILSIAPHAPRFESETTISYSNLNAQTVLVSITNSGSHPARITIPAQIRSNVGYTLSVSAKSSEKPLQQTPLLRQLRVTGKRATGRFVALDAVEAINVAAAFDATSQSTERIRRVTTSALVFPSSSPATLLTGPRISLAGASDCPHNAVEVIIQAEVEAYAEEARGHIELILSVSPNSESAAPALASR